MKGQIVGVAQDAHSLAWLEATSAGCRVHVRSLASGSERSARWAIGCNPAQHDVALAGNQLAWGGYEDVRCSETYADVYALNGARAKLVQELNGDCFGSSLAFQGLVSDGNVLLYSVLDSSRSGANCGNGGQCRFRLIGGRVVRVAGTRPATVSGLPPAALLAASSGRIALVPPARSYTWAGRGSLDWPRASASAPVQVRATATHAVVSTFTPHGTVRALALSTTRAAVLLGTAQGLAIEWYDAGSGARLGHVSVPLATAHELSTDGRHVAFAVGKSVRVLDLETAAQRVLAHATSAPVGLSVVAGRLVWGENTATKGDIRAANA